MRWLHNEKIHSFYRSPNILVLVVRVYKIEVSISCSQNEEYRIALKMFTGKRPLGRHRRRWEDNIRMDLKEIGINMGIMLFRLRIGIIGETL